MSTKGKRPLRSLTPSDKIHAIQRIHDGESKASVARDIGVPESTLRGWCKNEDKLRFMSRQSASDKLSADTLSDKLDGSMGLLGGPPEKRQKLDGSLPLNFSNKLRYDDMVYKRSSLNGLDYSTNKVLSDLSSFNGLAPDYVTFNGGVKNKVFGADISRPVDPSLTAISPLSSLTHLSGLSSLSQSPLAMSFNELTSNLNLLAQLNTGLTAMSGLTSSTGTASTLRNIKPKSQQQQIQSPRSENNDRQQGLSVKNWAKQQKASGISDGGYGLNLSQSEATKNKMKCPSPSLAPSLGGNLPPMPTIADDPLLYWLKSQQAMLGLNNLYPPPPPLGAGGAGSPPMRSSTPQQPNQQHANTPPIASTPLTPSSTPSGSLDDKNSAWFNWCKALGALAPAAAAAAAMQAHPMQPTTSATCEAAALTAGLANDQKQPFENILYSQLTKDTGSPSVLSSSSADNMHNNDVSSNTDSAGKPEDLSAKSTKTISPAPSPLPTPAQSPAGSPTQHSPAGSPIVRSEADTATTTTELHERTGGSVADCKDVLDNLLYKINNNPNASLGSAAQTPGSLDAASDTDESEIHNGNHKSDDDISESNNNNHSNKTDEEERARCAELADAEECEAIEHGEKFLKWLEKCSNPRVSTVHLMQLRVLIAAIKSGGNEPPKEPVAAVPASADATSDPEEPTAGGEESSPSKSRRRK